MWSSRGLVGSLVVLVMLLVIAALVLMEELNKQAPGSPTCYIGGRANAHGVNTYLCTLLYWTSGVSLGAVLLLQFFMCGKLWFRGGCYKFCQLLLLLVPAVAWGVAAGLVTASGLDANSSAASGSTAWWLRTSLIAVSLATFAALAAASLARALVKPGKILQGELDLLEAQKRAEADVARLTRQYGNAAARAYGGLQSMRKAHVQRHLGRMHKEYSDQGALGGKRHGGGYVTDGKSFDDEVYMPRHPSWYGRWLLPREVDLSRWPFMPSVLHQGTLGSCCAHAATNAYRFALEKEARLPKGFMPSRMFIWYYGKQASGSPGTSNSGCSIRSAFKMVQQHGVCPESVFPYGPEYLQYCPSQACIDSASRYKKKLRPIKLLPSTSLQPLAAVYGWPAVQARYGIWTYACMQPAAEKLYTIMAALARGHPIACAIRIPRYFHDLDEGCCELFPPASPAELEGNVEGGERWGYHAVLLVGYDRRNGWAKFQNSWGEDWGDDGFFYTPLEFLADPRLANDFWFFND